MRPIRWVFAGLAVLGAIVTWAGFAARGSSPAATRPLVFGATLLLLGALGDAYLWLWTRNGRLLIGVDRFGVRNAFGREHVWTPDQVGRLVDVRILPTAKGGSAQRVIYFLRPDGRTLLMLNPNAWSGDAIDRIVQVTGRPLEQPEPMTRAAFAAAFPRATTWIGRHQNVTVAIGITGALVIAFAILLIQR